MISPAAECVEAVLTKTSLNNELQQSKADALKHSSGNDQNFSCGGALRSEPPDL